MPTLRRSKQEHFAQYLAEGKAQVDAYALAGYASNNRAAAYANASKLMAQAKIQQRILELRQAAARRHEITTANLIDDTKKIYEQAMVAKQFGAAVSAMREVAILAGKRVERREAGDPGDFERLSEEELDKLLAAEYERIQEIRAQKAANDCRDNVHSSDSRGGKGEENQ